MYLCVVKKNKKMIVLVLEWILICLLAVLGGTIDSFFKNESKYKIKLFSHKGGAKN